jgi:Tol biopolymer transport system component
MELIWSPDGTKLAYSISRCNADGFVVDSSLYIWDALENESRLILKTEKIILSPTSWDDVSMLIILGEEFVDTNTVYTLYEYDITQDELIFIGPFSLLHQ